MRLIRVEAMTSVVPTALRRKTARAAESDELGGLLAGLAPGCLDGLDAIWRYLGDELYALALWRTGSPADAEDAVQEAFVRLARQAGRLDNVRRPRTFLMTVVHRAAVDVIRRRRPARGFDEVPELIVSDEGIDDRLDAEKVTRHLLRLSPTHREVVYLRHFAGLSFREIGEVTRVSRFTSASRYRLALRRLRRMVGVES